MASATSKPAGPSVCRYCSTACTRDISSVYLNFGREEIYSKMLLETFNIVVYSDFTYENIFSYLICMKCICRLREAFKFKQQVLECELVLSQYIKQIASKSHNSTVLTSKAEVDVADNHINIEMKSLVKVQATDDDATDCEDEIKGKKIKSMTAEELLNSIKDEKKTPEYDYDEHVTDCEDEACDQPEEYIVPKEEPAIEESAYKLRKRKATRNINLKGSQTRHKKAKIKDSPKTYSRSKSKCSTNTDAPDHSEDVTIPEEEPVIEKSVLETRKRKKTRSIKLKESQKQPKKAKIKDSLNKVSNSTSKSVAEASVLPDESVATPDAAMINAKLIVKFSTTYPFKVNKNNSINCVYCKELFLCSQAKDFRTHVDTAHPYLDKTVAISDSPYSRLTRVDVSDLSCRICSQKFQTIEETAKHLKEEHEFTINLKESFGLVPFKLDSDQIHCNVCGIKFNALLKLSRHIGSHYALNICPVCGKKTERRSGHCTHSSSNNVVCASCKQSFESYDARKLHLKMSKGCMPLKCKDCGMGFVSREIRQRHYVESHGKAELIFKCTQCEQTFPYQTKLSIHYNSTHTDFYKCQYCDERLWSNVSLQTHVARIHTLEKAYKCEFCENSYFEKSLLKIHMRIHDDNKKYHCEHCGRMFVRRYRLRDHIVKSHPGVSVENFFK